jgi:hypothetical protein
MLQDRNTNEVVYLNVRSSEHKIVQAYISSYWKLAEGYVGHSSGGSGGISIVWDFFLKFKEVPNQPYLFSNTAKTFFCLYSTSNWTQSLEYSHTFFNWCLVS